MSGAYPEAVLTPPPWWGVVSSAAAPVLLIGGWTLAAARQSEPFDSMSQTISALAALDATDRGIMTTALIGVGLAHLGTAAALRGAATPGRLVLAVGGAATVLVAAFPLPTVAGDGGSSTHALVAGISFGALAIWPALAARRSRPPGTDSGSAGARPAKRLVPWSLRRTVATTAAAALLAGVGWFLADLTGERDTVGLSERVAAGAQAIWPLVAVLSARAAGRTR